MIQPQSFDYAALDPETRIVVQQRTSEIKGLMKRAAQDVVDIGLKLIEVKERLGHGAFLPWLAAEFEWSYPSAARFMQVGERFGERSSQIDNFAPSALYLLAAPSTPESAREEAITLASQGETVTHATAKEIVRRHRDNEECESDECTETQGAAPSTSEQDVAQPTTRKFHTIIESEAIEAWLDTRMRKWPEDRQADFFVVLRDIIERMEEDYRDERRDRLESTAKGENLDQHE